MGGQEDTDGGATAVGLSIAFDGNKAAVAFNELSGDEQSDACADGGTRGEECFEYPGQDCGRDRSGRRCY